MTTDSFTRRVLAISLVIGFALARPCWGATGAWSPRSSPQPTQLWTRAGLIRMPHPAGEIAPARSQMRHHASPPVLASTRTTGATQLIGGQREGRRSPSSAREILAGSGHARLPTYSACDRRAHSANLIGLAGVFHEAHAPPTSDRTVLVS